MWPTWGRDMAAARNGLVGRVGLVIVRSAELGVKGRVGLVRLRAHQFDCSGPEERLQNRLGAEPLS